MKNSNDERFIHIVGMYKSGTSWLLHILANHPEVIAWREFDIIRAIYDYRRNPLNASKIVFNRALRFIGRGGRLSSPPQAFIKDRETIIRNIFCGTGWVPMLGAEKQQRAIGLDYSNPSIFIDKLLSIDQTKLQADDSPMLLPEEFHNTLGVANSRKRDLEKFLQDVILVEDLREVPSLYFNYLEDQVMYPARIALKAADQLICIDQLRQVSRKSRKVVIVRDGRDAALSALAFAELMNKWEAPWIPKKRNYLEILNAWALRVSLLEKEIQKGDLLIIRYEDLKMNFESTCKSLFKELDLSSDINLIKNIKKNTDFKVVTGGRNPGEKAEHIIRSGLIGEWNLELDTTNRSMAWKMASYELSLLGYRKDGGFDDWQDCIKIREL